MKQSLSKFDTSIGKILTPGTNIIFILLSALAVVICVGYQWMAISYPYSMDYGEAPLVDQAMRLAAGQNIYRPDLSTAPYTISNYPPLYVVIIALGFKLSGPAGAFLFGRIVSALSAWLVGLVLGYIVYAGTKDRMAGYITGSIFIAFPFVMYWSPLLRIDMFALALSVSGLAFFIKQPSSKLRFMAGAFFLTAAIFTRQSYALAAPMAAFFWLIGHNWRRAISLALTVGGISLLIFVILNTVTQGGFFYNIITANVNDFGMERLTSNLGRFREAALIPFIIAVFSVLLIRGRNPLWLLSTPYLIGACLSALTIGKIGSNVNYMLELCAATSLAAGLTIAWSRSHVKIFSLQAALLIILIIGVGNMVNVTMRDYFNDINDRRARLEEIRKLDDFVAKTPGTMLADEYMGILTLQGRPLMIQPFEVTQLAWAKKWDQTPLLESIKKHEFAAIIIYDQPWAKERWTQEMLDTIHSSYVLSGLLAGNKIYQPPIQKSDTATLKFCPGSVWQLPSASSMGVKWQNGSLDFSELGTREALGVYAVADGLLTRQADWVDSVAILHDDPLQPGSKVWTIYRDMAASDGIASYIDSDFPPGSTNIAVKSGQLIGYQGTWSGKPLWAAWTHVRFSIIKPGPANDLPTDMTKAEILDPTTYLKLAIRPQAENKNSQKLECSQP